MKIVALPAAWALIALASCSHDPLAGLSAFEGQWTGTHRILGEDGEHEASYAVHREGDELVWDFRSGFQGGFTGTARQRWDEARRLLVETWTDSAQPDAATEVAGSFDAQGGVLLMSGQAPDWATGAPVGYRHRTTLVSRDEWNYVMQQEGADGGYRDVMWLHMIRRP